MTQAPFTVAIVGRPNVGKSTLFNRLIGQRVAIVDDQPGVTRDVISRPFEWNNVPLRFLDMGGYEITSQGEIEVNIRKQIEETVELADVLLLVVDITTGPTAEDEEAVAFVRRCGRPTVVTVNKADTFTREQTGLIDFECWGFDQVIPVSAMHGHGTGDLLDAIINILPERPAEYTFIDQQDAIRVAIVGRPNVGKSTLLNRLVGQERSLVSSIPGTTRDPVDTLIELEGQKFVLIDTAGIRRRSRILDLEKFAVGRGMLAIERADVLLLVVDGEVGVTETDANVFGVAYETGRSAVVVVNKWDLVVKDTDTAGACVKVIHEKCKFLRHCPIQFISALSGQRTQRLWEEIRKVYTSYTQRIPTSGLNDNLRQWVAYRPPHGIRGRHPKILYITQVDIKPPTFALFVRNPDALHLSYRRHLINCLRDTYGFEGTLIRLLVRESSRREWDPDKGLSSRDAATFQSPGEGEELLA